MRARRTFHPDLSGERRRGERRRGRNAAMGSVVVEGRARAELTGDLDELFREGARRMLAAALEAEVAAHIATHAELVDGRRHRPAGAVLKRAAAPLVSAQPKVAEVLPLLYRHELLSLDFAPALEGFFDTAAGLP